MQGRRRPAQMQGDYEADADEPCQGAFWTTGRNRDPVRVPGRERCPISGNIGVFLCLRLPKAVYGPREAQVGHGKPYVNLDWRDGPTDVTGVSREYRLGQGLPIH